MAIYHLRASMISRSQGRSATAAAAYRAAQRIEDRRTGLAFDYAARSGVDHTETLAPDHAPDWVLDRSELWNRVEEAETRKNSQVAREVRVALPADLTHAGRVALVRDFARTQFVDRGMVADIALHAPGRDGDDRNHHAHILLTTREIGPEGFAAKNRDWNRVDLLEGWREAWARDMNIALEGAGIGDRVDHRTLEAQRDEALGLAAGARARGDEAGELRETVRAIGLDRPALPQLSAGAWRMKARGDEADAVRAWHEVKARAAEVMEVARDLAGHVRDWLDRGADRVPDHPEPEPAGGRGREPEPDLATRLRAAWLVRRERAREPERPETAADRDGTRAVSPEDSRSLADRLRAVAAGLDPARLADRAAALRAEREAGERQAAREAQGKEQELLREREAAGRARDHGPDHGL